jgi:HPt (histidine-containing phosphotransfer) domain-containing protein
MKAALIHTIDRVDNLRLANGSLTDLSDLLVQMGNDKSFLLQLIQMFIAGATKSVNEAWEGLKCNDLEQTRSAVHRYKGSLFILGNTALPILAANIEHSIINGATAEDIREDMEFLDELSENLKAELKEHQNEVACT